MANQVQGPQVPEEQLEAVTAAMVAFHDRYHGRKPVTARTQMLGDDLLACLLGEVYTDVEKTMIELQRNVEVHSTRSAFQQAMEGRLTRAVEEITGRHVTQFLSAHHVGPDLELELFVLGPASASDRP